MTRCQLRSFLCAGTNALRPVVEFGSGRISEFNSKRKDITCHQIWQVVKPVNVEMVNNNRPFDSWTVELLICLKDTQDSLPDQYEPIIDRADEIGQQLTLQLNQLIDAAGTSTADFESGDPRTWKQIVLKGIKRDPVVKLYADCLTGISLSFTLSGPDLTNNCP